MTRIYISDHGSDRNDGLTKRTPIYSWKRARKVLQTIWRSARTALRLGRGYSGNSAPDSAQEQPSHTVDQRKWTVTAASSS